MGTNIETTSVKSNTTTPIDDIESFIFANNWQYERISPYEIVTIIKGQNCEYQVTVTWQEYSMTLHIAFSFVIGLPKDTMSSKREHTFLKLLSLMNESLQIGHFDLWREENAIIWRYGQVHNPEQELSQDIISYIFRIGIQSCERYFPGFQFVLWAGHSPAEALQCVLFETAGEA